MGAKVLGTVDLSAATPANVFAGSANGDTFKVIVTNRNTDKVAKIKLCLSSVSGTMQDAGMILPPDVIIPAFSSIPYPGYAVGTGWFLVGESDVTLVNMVAVGVES